MGSEVSKSSINGDRVNPNDCDFPNAVRRNDEGAPFALLHQCTLEKWKDCDAESANFSETVISCDGRLHKDCSFSFCTSRQGIINIDDTSSVFSFRKRGKFAKMADHFEYNHIPAQMSSVNQFRVKSVLCFRDSLVVLHLSRNAKSQFGLLDIAINKFLGIFGKFEAEFDNNTIAGEISPDRSRCLLRVPKTVDLGRRAGGTRPVNEEEILHLYDLKSKSRVGRKEMPRQQFGRLERGPEGETSNPSFCLFAFDPRFSWRRLAVTDFLERPRGAGGTPGLLGTGVSLVSMDTWQALHTNRLPPFPPIPPCRLQNQVAAAAAASSWLVVRRLMYSRDGSLIVAVAVDSACHCRHKSDTLGCRPVACAVVVCSGDDARTLHTFSYHRLTCVRHLCPVNYLPLFSVCGGRLALVQDQDAHAGPSSPDRVTQGLGLGPLGRGGNGSLLKNQVCVYRLPMSLNLQAACRVVILQTFGQEAVPNLPLPSRLVAFLLFKPEFDF